jgi:folate-binding protein YgfZ
VITLSDNRFLVVAAADHAPTLWNTLAAKAKAAGFPCWTWLSVRAAEPTVTPPTQEAFIPQMLNLDALDAIAFGKGCYTGQEIVARTQYRGRLKERLVLAHFEALPAAGDRLFAPSFGDQPCGTVVNAAPCPDGGSDFLAVAQIAAAADAAMRLKAPDGPQIVLLPLPYGLPAAGERAGRIA